MISVQRYANCFLESSGKAEFEKRPGFCLWRPLRGLKIDMILMDYAAPPHDLAEEALERKQKNDLSPTPSGRSRHRGKCLVTSYDKTDLSGLPL